MPSPATQAPPPAQPKIRSPQVVTRTCDNCRKRKIKCIEDDYQPTSRPCEGCSKLALECTHHYVKKKPGRKNTFALAVKAEQEGTVYPQHQTDYASGSTPSESHHNHRQSIPFDFPFTPTAQASSSTRYTIDPRLESLDYKDMHDRSNARGSTSSIYDQAPPQSPYPPMAPPTSYPPPPAQTQYPHASSSRLPYSSFALSPHASKDPGLNWLDSIFDPSGFTLDGTDSSGDPYGHGRGGRGGGFASDQAQLLSLESPEHLLANINGSNSGGGPTEVSSSLSLLLNPTKREPQLEDVTSWANISHFISLFLQYLYPLEPLVHRPTFAEHLATRRDKRDMDFRALLLSIVAYVISQLPTSRLVNDQFDIEGLKRLQRRCHRTCKVLQRTYYGPTNLTQITTFVFDTFYLLSIGLGHTAGARVGQAIQLAYSMGLHSDAKTNALGLDAIEVQLRRRVFWQLYASDKTRAIPGFPMLINDYQGVPSLPEPTDDDFITSQGMFPQPPSRTSVLAGFVCLSKIFIILSECFFHHRLVLSDMHVPTIGTDWTIAAEDRLHAVLREMPMAIQDPNCHPEEAGRRVFAMQRANVLITAAIAKFALYDLRAALNVDEDTLAREREANAREIHSLLMNIPVEDLASNGESVRAKVFHIACALCTHTGATETDQELIRDWCNMFSAISFVQMPPPPHGAEVMDSRANSPPALAASTNLSQHQRSSSRPLSASTHTAPGTVGSMDMEVRP